VTTLLGDVGQVSSISGGGLVESHTAVIGFDVPHAREVGLLHKNSVTLISTVHLAHDDTRSVPGLTIGLKDLTPVLLQLSDLGIGVGGVGGGNNDCEYGGEQKLHGLNK